MKCIDKAELSCWVIDYADYCRIVKENNEEDPDYWVREALRNHLLVVEKLENQDVYMFRIEHNDVVLSEGTEKDIMVKHSNGIYIYAPEAFFNRFELVKE